MGLNVFNFNSDVLRKLCAETVTNNNIFDNCAYYLLQYETMMKEYDIKNKSLKKLVEESQIRTTQNGKNILKTKQNEEININSGIEKALKKLSRENYLPKNKIPFKSKELAMTNFNIEIDNQKTRINTKGLPEEKIELRSLKFVPQVKIEKKIISAANKEDGSESNADVLNLQPTTPMKVAYSHTSIESFELEVDLVNHLSESGGVNKFQYDIINKPPRSRQVEMTKQVSAPSDEIENDKNIEEN